MFRQQNISNHSVVGNSNSKNEVEAIRASLARIKSKRDAFKANRPEIFKDNHTADKDQD